MSELTQERIDLIKKNLAGIDDESVRRLVSAVARCDSLYTKCLSAKLIHGIDSPILSDVRTAYSDVLKSIPEGMVAAIGYCKQLVEGVIEERLYIIPNDKTSNYCYRNFNHPFEPLYCFEKEDTEFTGQGSQTSSLKTYGIDQPTKFLDIKQFVEMVTKDQETRTRFESELTRYLSPPPPPSYLRDDQEQPKTTPVEKDTVTLIEKEEVDDYIDR